MKFTVMMQTFGSVLELYECNAKPLLIVGHLSREQIEQHAKVWSGKEPLSVEQTADGDFLVDVVNWVSGEGTTDEPITLWYFHSTTATLEELLTT